jgi:hypothetical protein
MPQRKHASKESETWELLTDGQTSLIVNENPDRNDETGNGTGGSVQSWKSARNGAALNEFGARRTSGMFSSGQ